MADEKNKGERVVVRVSKKSFAVISDYAEDKNISAGEACDLLINTAFNRLKALRDYARSVAKLNAGKTKPKKAAKAKPAKKAKAKKAAKAKPASTANGVAAHA